MSRNNPDELLALEVNKFLCTDCGECEKILPKFKTVYKGKISISSWAYQEENICQSIKFVIESCPEKAISLR